MRLSNERMPWDDFPLIKNPFVVDEGGYVLDNDGESVSYEPNFTRSFATWPDAKRYCEHTRGSVTVSLFRRNPANNAAGGGSVAHFREGKLTWKETSPIDAELLKD